VKDIHVRINSSCRRSAVGCTVPLYTIMIPEIMDIYLFIFEVVWNTVEYV
jgi:hypothetical protein